MSSPSKLMLLLCFFCFFVFFSVGLTFSCRTNIWWTWTEIFAIFIFLAYLSMGAVISRLRKRLFQNREVRILMVGLDASGKTTILYKLKLGEIVMTVPTIGIYSDYLLIFGWDYSLKIHLYFCPIFWKINCFEIKWISARVIIWFTF